MSQRKESTFMKKTVIRCLLAVLALCTVLSATVACQPETVTPTDTGNGETQAPDANYLFPDKIEIEDKELNILNFEEYYNAIIFVDTDDYGDKISQTVYDRNAFFYDKYKVDVVEFRQGFVDGNKPFSYATTRLQNAHNGGDDAFDVAYISMNAQYSLVSQGMMTDLRTVSTLELDAEYWDPQLSTSYILKDGRQYVASSPFHLMPYEMTWLIFFNQDMAETRSVPDLFEYVRQGEWTVETMLKTVKDCGIITENAEGGYTFDASGTATYGIALHSASSPKLLEGLDVKLFQEYDDEDLPYIFTCSDADAFAKANELLLQLFDRSMGMAIGSDYEDDLVNHPEGYVPVFHTNRALFLHAEIKSGMTLKKILNSEVYYGMLPQPKLDTEQKGYYTTMSPNVILFGIPTVCKEKEAVGTAADVLSYLSYRDLLPVYYDDYVSHRNASDQESLEMLNDYIMPGRRLDIGAVYGWASTFTSNYASLIYSQRSAGDTSLANIITSTSKSINTKIRTFFKD